MILLNNKTETLLEAFIRRPISSLILSGSRYGGVDSAVELIKSRLLKSDYTRNNIIQIEPDEDSNITIEQIRELIKSLNSLVKSDQDIARIAVIWHADTAAREAQNALLKLLEEPANQTLLILHADNMAGLLPTIVSRCQAVPVLPLSRKQVLELTKEHNLTLEESEKIYLLSGGAANLVSKYLDKSSIEQDDDLNLAKEFLNSGPDKRISQQKVFDTSEKTYALIDMLEKIASVGFRTSNGETSAKRWKHILHELRNCRNLLDRNVTTKLVYTRLCVSL